MKKVFTIFAAVAFAASTFAQTHDSIPNGSFEIWTSPLNPDNWTTDASATGFASLNKLATKDTSIFIHGHASTRMMTDTANLGGRVTLPSELGVGMGTYIPGQGISFPGIPFNKRADSVIFYVKYAPGRAIDTGFFSVNFSKAGVSLFGASYNGLSSNISQTGANWARYAINLHSYYDNTITGNPDTASIYFISSIDTTVYGVGATGSILWVDYVHVTVPLNTSIEALANNNGVNAYPNPANNVLNISAVAAEVGSAIHIFDIAGREVFNSTIQKTTVSIDTRNFESGIYSVRVNSIDNLTVYNGKVSIAH